MLTTFTTLMAGFAAGAVMTAVVVAIGYLAYDIRRMATGRK